MDQNEAKAKYQQANALYRAGRIGGDGLGSVVFRYNIFNNEWSSAVGVDGKQTITENTFLSPHSFRVSRGLPFAESGPPPPPVIRRNNFLLPTGKHGDVANQTGDILDLGENYWGTTNLENIRERTQKYSEPDSVLLEPILSGPVPMPFLTGIPEVDAVYEGPKKN